MFKERIRKHYDNLTPGFRQIADFIAHDTLEVAFLTISELSQEVGVDPATVVRFAQEIGYSGFRELSREIKKYVRDQITAARRGVSDANSIEGVASQLVAVLQQDLQHFASTDIEVFAAAIAALEKASHVWMTGEFMSYDIASFMAQALQLIGVSSSVVQPDIGATSVALMKMQSEDALLAIVSIDSGVSAGTIIRKAREKGLVTVVITGSSIAYTAREAEHVVTIPIRNIQGIPSFSFLFVIIALFWEALAHRRHEKSLESLVSFREQLQTLL